MTKLSNQDLDDIERYRPYHRKRHGMGICNIIFVVMVFVGGTYVYAPPQHPHKTATQLVEPFPKPATGDLPAMTEEEFRSVDWRTK